MTTAIYEYLVFQIGERVRVHLSAECNQDCGLYTTDRRGHHLDHDGLTGTVVQRLADDHPDNLNHPYRVDLDRSLPNGVFALFLAACEMEPVR